MNASPLPIAPAGGDCLEMAKMGDQMHAPEDETGDPMPCCGLALDCLLSANCLAPLHMLNQPYLASGKPHFPSVYLSVDLIPLERAVTGPEPPPPQMIHRA